jgi:hypothetical protein
MTVTVTQPTINVREKLNELDKPTGIAGQAMLAAETPQEQQALIGVGRRNIIKNGALQVWQRGTSFTSVSANDTFTADRFAYQEGSSTTAAYTISQSTGPVEYGFDRSFKIEVTTADTSLADNQYAQIHYPIEGQDLQQMAKGTSGALPVTMSFWVKSNVTGAYAATLWDGPNSRQNSAHYTVDAADVWEHKVITYAADTTGTIDNDNTEGLAIKFVLSAGVDYTGGTEGPTSHSGSGTTNYAAKQVANLVTATGNYWEITGVQLELGKVATPFEHRSYGEELAACQRYTYVIGGSGVTTLGGGSMYNSTAVNIDVSLPVQMRDTSPSLTPVPNGTGNWLNVYVGATGTNSNATPQLGDNAQASLRIYATNAHSGSSPSAAGAAVWCMVLAGAKLIISEEL